MDAVDHLTERREETLEIVCLAVVGQIRAVELGNLAVDARV